MTGVWCFDPNYATDADQRAYWLEMVQRFNGTGPYAVSTARKLLLLESD